MATKYIYIFNNDGTGLDSTIDPSTLSLYKNNNLVSSTFISNGDGSYRFTYNGSGVFKIGKSGIIQDETEMYLTDVDNVLTSSLSPTYFSISGGQIILVSGSQYLADSDVKDDFGAAGSTTVPSSRLTNIIYSTFVSQSQVTTGGLGSTSSTNVPSIGVMTSYSQSVGSALNSIRTDLDTTIVNPKILTGASLKTKLTQADDAIWQLNPSNVNSIANETIIPMYIGPAVQSSASYVAAGASEYTPDYRVWRENSKSSYVVKFSDTKMVLPNMNTLVCHVAAHWTGSNAVKGKFRFRAENVSGSVQRDSEGFHIVSVSKPDEYATFTLDISSWLPSSTMDIKLYMVASESIDFSAHNAGMLIYTTNMSETAKRLQFGLEGTGSTILPVNDDAV